MERHRQAETDIRRQGRREDDRHRQGVLRQQETDDRRSLSNLLLITIIILTIQPHNTTQQNLGCFITECVYISIATACNGITFTTKYNTLSTDHDKGEFIPDCCIASREAPPVYHTYALVTIYMYRHTMTALLVVAPAMIRFFRMTSPFTAIVQQNAPEIIV